MKPENIEAAYEAHTRIKACQQLMDGVGTGPLQITVSGMTLTIQESDLLRDDINHAVRMFLAASLNEAKSNLAALGVKEPSDSEITGFPEDDM